MLDGDAVNINPRWSGYSCCHAQGSPQPCMLVPARWHWGSRLCRQRKGRESPNRGRNHLSSSAKAHRGWAGHCWLAAGSALGHPWPWLNWETPWLCPASGLCAMSWCWSIGGGTVVASRWRRHGGHVCHPGLGCARVSHPAVPWEVLPDGGRPCEVWPRGLTVPSHAAVPGGKFPISLGSQKSGEVSALALLSQLTLPSCLSLQNWHSGLSAGGVELDREWAALRARSCRAELGSRQHRRPLQPFSWPLSQLSCLHRRIAPAGCGLLQRRLFRQRCWSCGLPDTGQLGDVNLRCIPIPLPQSLPLKSRDGAPWPPAVARGHCAVGCHRGVLRG